MEKLFRDIVTHSNYSGGSKLAYLFEQNRNWLQILGIEDVECFNREIAMGNSTEIKLMAEMLHEKEIGHIADQIASNARQRRVVLISGPSSSGKTTFARRLVMHLKMFGIKTDMISMDNYFLNRDQTPLDGNGQHDFEAVEALDLELFNRNLVALLKGDEIEEPIFDFQEGKREAQGRKKRISQDTVMVMEGIHGMNDKLTSLVPSEAKFRIYISAVSAMLMPDGTKISSADCRCIRRIVRDYKYRGTDAGSTIARWPSVRRGEERCIFPFQENADVMFDSWLPYELGVLKTYAREFLLEVREDEAEFTEAKRLIGLLNTFETVDKDYIPSYSLLREFIGGSSFEEDAPPPARK